MSKIQDKINAVLKEEQVNEMTEDQMVFMGFLAIEIPLFLAFLINFGIDGWKNRHEQAAYLKKMYADQTETTKSIVKYFLEQMATTPHMTEEVKKKYLKIIHKKQAEADKYTGVDPAWVYSMVRSMTKDAPEFLKSLRSDKMLGGMFMQDKAKYKRVAPEGDHREVANKLLTLLKHDQTLPEKYFKIVKYFTNGKAPQLRLGTIEYMGYITLRDALSDLLDDVEKNKNRYRDPPPELEEIYNVAKTLLNMENAW